MKVLGNIIWFLLGGAIVSLVYFILGILCCVTVILIPFGRQCFKLAGLIVAPFGKDVETCYEENPYLNILWSVGGLYAFVSLVVGAVLCVTIIGIPFGKQCFKIARLASSPFGAIVV